MENEFALTTDNEIEFIKIEEATLAIQSLPFKLNNTYSKTTKSLYPSFTRLGAWI